MSRIVREWPVLLVLSVGFPGGWLIGATAMDAIARDVPPETLPAVTPTSLPVASPVAPSHSGPRYATVDVATIVFRGELRGESFERHREIVARHGAVIDACIAECKALAAEIDLEAARPDRESYSQSIATRIEEVTARWEAARAALQDEMSEATGTERERVRKEVADAVTAIARREGYALVFNRPYLEGSAVWDEEDDVPYAPLAACPDCPDLSLEVAAALGLPDDFFEDESEFRRTRVELVEEYYRLREPPPWLEE